MENLQTSFCFYEPQLSMGRKLAYPESSDKLGNVSTCRNSAWKGRQLPKYLYKSCYVSTSRNSAWEGSNDAMTELKEVIVSTSRNSAWEGSSQALCKKLKKPFLRAATQHGKEVKIFSMTHDQFRFYEPQLSMGRKRFDTLPYLFVKPFLRAATQHGKEVLLQQR